MKKIRLSTAIAIIMLAVVTAVNGTMIVVYDIMNETQSNYQEMQKRVSKLYEVMDIVDRYYVGDVDNKMALEMAAAGYVDGIGDRWSYYLTPEQYKERISDDNKNLVGIGVNVVYEDENQSILVTNVYPDSPAEKAGIEKFDYITAVNSKEVSVVGYEDAVNEVRGEDGTKVSIQIERDGEEEILSIKRDTVKKISVYSEIIDQNIGYIQITEFEADTANQFEKAVEDMQSAGVDAFIFDVRNNPGGFLTTLIDCLDIVVPKGTIMSTETKDGEVEIYESDEDFLDYPIVVLANENSYSAAEFFASSIQEYGIGKVIGTKTTGKGYTQSPIELSDGSAIILSTKKYYTANGLSLANIGIEPDIRVTLSDEQKEEYYRLTSDTDPQIIKAVEEISIELLN